MEQNPLWECVQKEEKYHDKIEWDPAININKAFELVADFREGAPGGIGDGPEVGGRDLGFEVLGQLDDSRG